MKGTSKVHVHNGSLVFGKYGLAGLGILLFLSILLAWTELIWVLMSCFIILIISRFWTRWSLEKFTLSEFIPVREVFPEEEVAIEFHLQNRKRLPIPWVHLKTEGIQRNIVQKEAELSCSEVDLSQPPEDQIYKVGWISGREKVSYKQQTKLFKRGVYKVSASKIVSGDPFSLFRSERDLSGFTEVIVYPRLLAFNWPEFGIKSPNGDLADNNFIFTDPAYKAGLRDYLPSDSLKNINWAASARFQVLKSNLLEGKAVSRTFIYLNEKSLKQSKWEREKRDFAWELLISGVASLAMYLSSSGKEWDFITDAGAENQKTPAWSTGPYSTSPSQKTRQLLINLARKDIHLPVTDPMDLFKHIGVRSGTLVVFSARYNTNLAGKIQATGKFRQIKWLVLEDSACYGDEIISLKPGWNEDLKLKQLLCS
ncbi:MAG: DUF58 domain-containing protein [Peptococcaceae bacterium]|nr:DUF58 domain-containing protein [Peptococcaceae bacterium]